MDADFRDILLATAGGRPGLAAALLAKEFEVSEAAETVRTETEDAPP